jgi:hypothetical protein
MGVSNVTILLLTGTVLTILPSCLNDMIANIVNCNELMV